MLRMTNVENPQYNRATCYFCLSEETEVLQEHHIVPRRFDGSDSTKNLVRLCPTCHEKIERLYDSRFYEELNQENANKSCVGGMDFKSQAKVSQDVQKIIQQLQDETENEATRPDSDDIIRRAYREFGYKQEVVVGVISELRDKGEIYTTPEGAYTTV